MAGEDGGTHGDGLDPQRLAGEAAQAVGGAASSAKDALDDGIAVASGAVKSGAARARVEYSKARERGQSILDTSAAHTQAALDSLFARLREGVHIALEHPNTSYTVGFGAALLLLPGTRRLLWRQTIGRFRSEEAIFKAAELKAAHLRQSVDGFDAEGRKLAERLAAAQEQYAAGLAKLKATNRQLQALASSVQAAERKAEALLRDLRDLPSGPALALRAEVSLRQAAAARQAAALEKQVYALSKKGF